MLHVATTAAAFVDLHLFVRFSVTVGVAVGPQIQRVGDVNHHAIVEGQHHARQEDVVDEDAVLVVLAITVGILVTRYPAPRFLFTGGVGSLHVGAHLHHVEHSVPVPRAGHRFLDVGLTQDELQGVAFRQLDRLVRLLDGEEASLVDSFARLGSVASGGGEGCSDQYVSQFHGIPIDSEKENDGVLYSGRSPSLSIPSMFLYISRTSLHPSQKSARSSPNLSRAFWGTPSSLRIEIRISTMSSPLAATSATSRNSLSLRSFIVPSTGVGIVGKRRQVGFDEARLGLVAPTGSGTQRSPSCSRCRCRSCRHRSSRRPRSGSRLPNRYR